MSRPQLPAARPEATREQVEAYVRAAGIAPDAYPYLVGRRGYYRDTMGAPGVNEWGLFDDALWLVTAEALHAFNANTDPTREYPNVAVLEPGRWWYWLGIHNASKDPKLHPHYEALVEAAEVVVRRVGTERERVGLVDWRGTHLGLGRWRGSFGINIHHGTEANGTSSAGCQTIPLAQWAAFLAAVKAALAPTRTKRIAYVLTVREDAPR